MGGTQKLLPVLYKHESAVDLSMLYSQGTYTTCRPSFPLTRFFQPSLALPFHLFPYRAAHLPFLVSQSALPCIGSSSAEMYCLGQPSGPSPCIHGPSCLVFRSSPCPPSICLYIPAPPPPSLGPELSLQPLFFCFLLLLKLGRPIGFCHGFVSLNPFAPPSCVYITPAPSSPKASLALRDAASYGLFFCLISTLPLGVIRIPLLASRGNRLLS